MEGCMGSGDLFRDGCSPNPNVQPILTEKRDSYVEYGTRVWNCVQSLIAHPALPEVPEIAKFLGSGMTSQKFTLAQIKDHSDSDSCWMVLHDMVYDVTEFLHTHPGGCEIILENAGSDATVPFESKGHSQVAYSMLQQYCIGQLIENDQRLKPKPS